MKFTKDHEWLKKLRQATPPSVCDLYHHIMERCGYDGKGECFESQEAMGKALDLAPSTVRIALSVLTWIDVIEIKKTGRVNVISIVEMTPEKLTILEAVLTYAHTVKASLLVLMAEEQKRKAPSKSAIRSPESQEAALTYAHAVKGSQLPLMAEEQKRNDPPKSAIRSPENQRSDRQKISDQIASFPAITNTLSVKERFLKEIANREAVSSSPLKENGGDFVSPSLFFDPPSGLIVNSDPKQRELDQILIEEEEKKNSLQKERSSPAFLPPLDATDAEGAGAGEQADGLWGEVEMDRRCESWFNDFTRRLFEFIPKSTPRHTLSSSSWVSLLKLAAGNDLRIDLDDPSVSAILSPNGIGELVVVHADTSNAESTRYALKNALSVFAASPFVLTSGTDADLVHTELWEMIKRDKDFNILRFYVVDTNLGTTHYLRFAHDGPLGKPQSALRDLNPIPLRSEKKIDTPKKNTSTESEETSEKPKRQRKQLMTPDSEDRKQKTLAALKRQARAREAMEAAAAALRPASLASEPNPQAKSILKAQAEAREVRALVARERRLQQKCVDAVALVGRHETPASLTLEFGNEYTPSVLHAWWNKLAEFLSIPSFAFEPKYSKQWEQLLKRCVLNKVDAVDFIYWSMTSWKKIQEHHFSYREVSPVPSLLVSGSFFERVSKLYSDRVDRSSSSTEGKKSMKEKWENF